MDATLIAQLTPRSSEEIVAQLRELIHRHRRRYIKKLMRPCPNNCQKAWMQRNKVAGCHGCKAFNPEQCADEAQFAPVETKEEVAEAFAADIRDIDVLRHDYRDLMVLMWVLGIPIGEQEAEMAMSSIEEKSND